jgi:putative membrane protein
LRYVAWGVRLLLFGLLFGFALKNTDPVNLRFYFDYVWSAPLVLVLLFFFAGGVVIGVIASMVKVYRQRREIVLLKRELRAKSRGEAQAP